MVTSVAMMLAMATASAVKTSCNHVSSGDVRVDFSGDDISSGDVVVASVVTSIAVFTNGDDVSGDDASGFGVSKWW